MIQPTKYEICLAAILQIINGPEILNKFVGQSEENIRALFKDAEDEYKKVGSLFILYSLQSDVRWHNNVMLSFELCCHICFPHLQPCLSRLTFRKATLLLFTSSYLTKSMRYASNAALLPGRPV